MNNINSTHEYRHYLQNNYTELLNKTKAYLHQNNTCGVEGRCLPMVNNVINSQDPNTGLWDDNSIGYTEPAINNLMTVDNK
jgi:hypothetical protein